MILVNDLRPGSTFGEDNNIYITLDVSRNKTARAQMNIKVKTKNLRTGVISEKTYTNSDKVEPIFLEKRDMSFLYEDDSSYVFMDNSTYDQEQIAKNLLDWEKNFLVENVEFKITYYQNEVVGVELPVKMELEIVECPPAVKGDTVNKATKDAVLETGLKVKVPLFIENGEVVIIKTEDGSYVSRGKKKWK